MSIFKLRKTNVAPVSSILPVSSLNVFSDFGSDIESSDIVKICIDRIASHSAKLKPRYIKTSEGILKEMEGNLSYILKYKPNELMTPYEFIYKVVSLLVLNNNCFIYPLYDKDYSLIGLYPLTPHTVEVKKDNNGEIYLHFYFDNSESYILPLDSVIILRKFFRKNDILGGNNSLTDHKSILKTISINDSILQGIEGAVKSSFQIKGLLKMNAMLSESDKKKQKQIFDEVLKSSIKDNSSSIIPIDLKAEYVPLQIDPKLVDEATLNFLQKKILSYFGVSEPIFLNKYNEEEFNAFYEGCIEQISIQLSEAFTTNLLTKKQIECGEEIIFYSERLQYASWNTKVNAIEKLMGLGIMSLNESRALLGLEPVEGGEKRLQSLNFVSLDKVDDYQLGSDKLKK
jgi:HK97 family phage portal protein